jgi:glycosyltransferase involved in cell wall biosynthesis
MKVLIAHNRYQQHGGEDRVVDEEAAMLERCGHDVARFLLDNDTIQSPLQQLRAAVNSLYSWSSAEKLSKLMKTFRPDMLHVHNFLPNLSPSVFFVAKREHVPVVQTLHNYRLICANGLLFREGNLCGECVQSSSFLPGVRHACYRGSRLGSAVVGGGIGLHATLGTWTRRVDRYIALTRFAAQQVSPFRIPAELIRVKPNFVRDTEVGLGQAGFILFAGRLSPEKGLRTLLEADRMGFLRVPVVIAGDGPLMFKLGEAASQPGSRLKVLGAIDRPRLQQLMRDASALVVPSLWYEPCPMVIIEALAAGLPVVCSALGGLPELIGEGAAGLTFTPGDPVALAAAVNRFASVTPETATLRQGARTQYEERFSEAQNYRMLMEIYGELLSTQQSSSL